MVGGIDDGDPYWLRLARRAGHTHHATPLQQWCRRRQTARMQAAQQRQWCLTDRPTSQCGQPTRAQAQGPAPGATGLIDLVCRLSHQTDGRLRGLHQAQRPKQLSKALVCLSTRPAIAKPEADGGAMLLIDWFAGAGGRLCRVVADQQLPPERGWRRLRQRGWTESAPHQQLQYYLLRTRQARKGSIEGAHRRSNALGQVTDLPPPYHHAHRPRHGQARLLGSVQTSRQVIAQQRRQAGPAGLRAHHPVRTTGVGAQLQY